MAGMGKVKALQIWCKNRVIGYRDVEITNMTSSWRDGLAFCALIHKFRPDLIDYDSLSKENIFENNDLAFEVAEGLGVPALLDAEDMLRLETPDKLSIITYVAQLHNYFRDKEPAGGPGIKTAAAKRHSTPVQRSVTMRSPESKRKPALSTSKRAESHTTSPGADICVTCDGKVYLIEKHIVDGKLYHRSCYKRNTRSERPTSVFISTPRSTEASPSPLRPVSLVSNGLKKPSTSLPTTPSSPSDSRPDWQRRVQDKTVVRRNITGAINRTSAQPGLEPLKEDTDSATKTRTTNIPKTEAERVKLRCKPLDTVLRKSPLPRAASVGADLDERISKLRQLRASAKASGAAPSAAVKARLERLHALSSAGVVRTESDSQTDSTDTSEQRLTVDGSAQESHTGEPSAQPVTSPKKEETTEHVSDSNIEQEHNSAGKQGANSSMETSNDSESDSKAEIEPSDPIIIHSNEDLVDESNKVEQISDNVIEPVQPVVDITSCAMLESGADLEIVASAGASTNAVVASTNPFEDDSDDVTSTQLSHLAAETDEISDTVSLQTSTAPLVPSRSKRSPSSKALTSASSPSATISSPSSKLAGKKTSAEDLQSVSPATARRPVSSLNVTAGKSPKPERPPVSPAVTKRLTSKDPESHGDSESHSRSDSTSLLTTSDVVMKHGGNNSNKVPHRPATAAAGSVTKSQFYMDKSHTNIKEPPPKPARQSPIVKAVTKAKDNWEDALQSWSVKRKDQRSTWYTTENYPTEHNPFDEEEDGLSSEENSVKINLNHNNAMLPTVTTTNYDNTLNPFADDDEDEVAAVVQSAQSNTVKDETPRKKIIPANPFEVSDEEEEESITRKKIIPEQEISTEKFKGSTAKQRNVITLPDTSKKATPKKKAAPPPPTQTPPTPLQAPSLSSQTPPTSLQAPIMKSVTKQEDVNSAEIFITNDDPKFNDMNEEENKSADGHRKKHRPAPPRPLPPKRRIYPVFQLSV